MEKNKTIGSAMVVGAGIAGMQAALDLAESGIKVYLVEKSSAIGGRMVQLDKTFPTNECAMCVVSPKLVECGRHLNIEIITNSEIEKLTGEPGNFTVTLRKKPRYIIEEKCTACGDCSDVCPVSISNDFDQGISKHKAIYRLYPQAVPRAFAISKTTDLAPCVFECPAHINVQGYVALTKAEKFDEAYELIRESVPFPGVLGRVCHHPCEKECNRKEIEEAIDINRIKRFISDKVTENYEKKIPFAGEEELAEKDLERKAKRSKRKVAVIGGGPAGLTSALSLKILGYQVTVFEELPVLGGMLAVGIPQYRLPKKVLDFEIQQIVDSGIEVRTNRKFGRDFTLDDLKKEGIEAVFVAVGASLDRKINIPGCDAEGVLSGMDVLPRINLGQQIKLGKKILVIGGGNVAVDVACSAKRLGKNVVEIVCLEKKEEMPAHPWEVEQALEEGVVIHNSFGLKAILTESGKAKGIRAVECKSVFDKKGKFKPLLDESVIKEFYADTIIIAVGQQCDSVFLSSKCGLKTTKQGLLKVDSLTKQTPLNWVFAGGDAVGGPGSVIEAIASGKEAAISIDRFLFGEDLAKGRQALSQTPAKLPEKPIVKITRKKIKMLPLAERVNNFKEIELVFDEKSALLEANRCLNCAFCCLCKGCVKVCEAEAIDFEQKEERININTGALLLTPGVELFDANIKKEYGSDRYDNVITSIQFERILSSSGPTKGEVLRLSDGTRPKKIAFIQCVGSRDSSCRKEFCSSVCCMYSIKQAVISKEHDPEIEPTVFYIDIRSFGKDFERYYENAKKESGVKFTRCVISKIYEQPKSKNLMVKYINEKNQMEEAEFDLIVLAVGLTDTQGLKPLAETLGIEINEDEFIKTNRSSPAKTSKNGIYVAGTYAEPKDIPETVIESSCAAALASELLKDARGSLLKRKVYPPERDVADEDVRIGVFICRCGRNIAAVVNVPEVVEYASKLKDVVYAGEFLYSCSKDALDVIKEKISEHNLNRVVVASCTPRTHEELFRDTIREAGLNRYLFEMTSLREQVSWVHKDFPQAATRKSKELVNMTVAKVRLTKPLERELSDVIPKALVIGGGASGMQAALGVAKQGYEVYLAEKENHLGGHLNELFDNLEEENPQLLLSALIEKVKAHKKIRVMLESEIKTLSGFTGNYTSVISCEGKEEEINYGVVILAAGAKAYEPKKEEFGYGQSPNVITQVKLDELLAKGPGDFSSPKTFVMIQCVGSRNDEHPYCSRVCCAQAVKNALRLKKFNSGHKIIVLYRDIRTYGFLEKYYLQARDAGVIFLRFDTEKEPEVKAGSSKITVRHVDAQLKSTIAFEPDFVVLSAGIISGPNQNLAKTLKVPLTADGFFMEAHVKIRPLDFTSEGMFFCGLAHSPRFLHESLTQAQGASIRAVTILSKQKIETKAITAMVNERLCKGCGLCVSVCRFDARELDDETKTAKVIDVLCQGCGACAAICPSEATIHKGFTKKQIMAMVDKTT